MLRQIHPIWSALIPLFRVFVFALETVFHFFEAYYLRHFDVIFIGVQCALNWMRVSMNWLERAALRCIRARAFGSADTSKCIRYELGYSRISSSLYALRSVCTSTHDHSTISMENESKTHSPEVMIQSCMQTAPKCEADVDFSWKTQECLKRMRLWWQGKRVQ